MYNRCMQTQIIIKNLPHIYIKIFCLVYIKMINLSFDELRSIVQIRNRSDFENKSKDDLTKALSEPKRETPKPKSETPKPKPEIPKPK